MIKPYIIIPNLIEQPTWGGSYIAKTKKIKDPAIAKKKIGQSYELYQDTNLSRKRSTESLPSLELGSPTDPTQARHISKNDKPININLLMKKGVEAVLGARALKVHGKKMNILIKFTQAKGNSYQIHVKKNQKDPEWQAKPESWYYFEQGQVTLGAKPGIDWEKYEQTCKRINQQAIEISQRIKSGELKVKDGRNELREIIKANNPEQFVNVIKIRKDQAIDLSSGGVHHSWEENPSYAPNGNIVYEVQRNVFDPVSTIRSFDKGKIKSDGSIRKIHINDYFKYIDRSPRANEPNTHFRSGRALMRLSGAPVKQIFKTPDYSLQELIITQPFNNKFTRTKGSFHHLFVRAGNLLLHAGNDSWIITQGYSVFIPQATKQYTAKPYKCKQATILKTYL